MEKQMRDIVEINEELCNGCGQCILDCAEGAIALVDGKAKVISDMYCDGLGACLSGCPTGALRIVRREADAYDEDAVKRHLATMGRTLHGESHAAAPQPKAGVCGCPHSAPRVLSLEGTGKPFSGYACPGSLPEQVSGQAGNRHWPLKLRLMAPDAPFLRGAEMLLSADCAAYASAEFHSKLRQGGVSLIACPKFEGMQELTEHLTLLFNTAKPAGCTVVRMEVPCCRGLIQACLTAKRDSGLDIPVRDLVITRRGDMHAEPSKALQA